MDRWLLQFHTDQSSHCRFFLSHITNVSTFTRLSLLWPTLLRLSHLPLSYSLLLRGAKLAGMSVTISWVPFRHTRFSHITLCGAYICVSVGMEWCKQTFQSVISCRGVRLWVFCLNSSMGRQYNSLRMLLWECGRQKRGNYVCLSQWEAST